MQTIAVIKHLDVMDYITSRIAPGKINYLSSPFGFQTVKEILHKQSLRQQASGVESGEKGVAKGNPSMRNGDWTQSQTNPVQ
jgi:hypothetical protein